MQAPPWQIWACRLASMPERPCLPASVGLGDQTGWCWMREVLSPRSPRAQGGDKTQGPVPPHHLGIVGVADRNAVPRRCGSLDPMPRQRGCPKEPIHGSPLGRYAVQPPFTPVLNLNAAIVRTTIQGLAVRRRCGSEAASQITGSPRGAAWQAEIAQVFQRFEGEANVRYLTIIGHSLGGRARRRDARERVEHRTGAGHSTASAREMACG